MEEHLKHLAVVLGRLRSEDYKAKLSKCCFAVEKVGFLGHVVSNGTISMEEDKLLSIKEWATPTNVKQLRSFLGLASYYRKFVRSFAALASPLSCLLEKSKPFEWGNEQQAAFEEIKRHLCSSPVLLLPDPSKPFTIYSDASNFALGAVLCQVGSADNCEHPVAFMSRALNKAEKNYSVQEKECLAIISAIEKWRHYVDGTSFVVVTDHQSLRYLYSQKHLHGRLARWIERIQPYACTIKYQPGSKQTVPDALSRAPQFETALVGAMVEHRVSVDLGERIKTAYLSDSLCSELLEKLRSEEVALDAMTARHYSLLDGFLLFAVHEEDPPAVVVPNDKELRALILSECHDAGMSGHQGRKRTYAAVRAKFYWLGLTHDVKRYCETCLACQQMKAGTAKQSGQLLPLPIPPSRWQSVGMDLVCGLPLTKAGFDTIVTVVDRLTRRVVLIATDRHVTAAGIARLFICEVVRLYGMPLSMVTDCDPRFTSGFWQALHAQLGTKLMMSTSHHPQTDGMSERKNQELESYLRLMAGKDPESWDVHLPLCEFALNNAPNATTGVSPFFLDMARTPNMPLDICRPKDTKVQAVTDLLAEMKTNILMAQDAIVVGQKRQIRNKKGKDVNFEVGEKVYYSTQHMEERRRKGNFAVKWAGPFEVVERVGPLAYRLLFPVGSRLHDVVSVQLLKRAEEEKRGEFPGRGRSSLVVSKEAEEEPAWQVETLVGQKASHKGKVSYLVHWKDHGDDDDSWVETAVLEGMGAGALVEKYKQEAGFEVVQEDLDSSSEDEDVEEAS